MADSVPPHDLVNVSVLINQEPDGEILHVEVFDTEPSFDLYPCQSIYLASVNGGASTLLRRADSAEFFR